MTTTDYAIVIGTPLLSAVSVLGCIWLHSRLKGPWYHHWQHLRSAAWMLTGGNSIHFSATLGPQHTYHSLFRWRGPWQPNAMRVEHMFRKQLDELIVTENEDGETVPASTHPEFVPPPYSTSSYTLKRTKV